MTTSTPSAAAPATDPFVRRLAGIQSAIDANQLAEAARALNAVQREQPKDARIFLLGMRLAEAAGNAAGAIDAVRRALALAPGWPVAVTEHAALLSRQEKHAEAMAEARKAVALDPRNPGVIGRAVAIAQRAQDPATALQWLELATTIDPSNVDTMLLKGHNLRYLGRHAEAIALYTRALESHADWRDARLGRAQAAHASGDGAAAVADCDRLLAASPNDEEVAFLRQLALGETPATQPAAVTRNLFDPAAATFDELLVVGLKYKLPKLVADRILAAYPDKRLNLLDLGCGTGLLGVCLGRLQGALIGVDLSQAMVAQAMRHDVYDRFHTVNVLDALAETPADLYQVVAALDVFIYVGDLLKAIPDAHRIVAPGGSLVFSCETATDEEADLLLRPTMRYAHKASAVEALCKSAGFANVTIEHLTLRTEGGEPLAGFLVTAEKAAA